MKKILFLVIPIFCLSVPSDWQEVKTFTQPDATQFQGRLIGDEHYHFVEDLEGYVIVNNVQGWWTYAKKENGLLEPTKFIVGSSLPPYTPHLRPSIDAVARLERNKYTMINQYPNMLAENEAKVEIEIQRLGRDLTNKELNRLLGLTGENSLICLLAAFSDSGFGWVAIGETPAATQERRHFWGIAFGDSVPPLAPDSSRYSMNNYYWEAAYAKLKWTGDIDSIRNSNRTRSSANTSTTSYIRDACVAADPYINFSLYDDNGDGYVDQLFVIHPGRGEEESGDPLDIWSASYTGLSFGPYDGVRINRAVVIPENAKLGVFCHELFHQFASAPDLYDYNYDGNGIGDYCLMSSGSWNGDPGGTSPSHMCALLKYDCDGGWGSGSGSISGWLGASAVKIPSELTANGKYYITQLDSQPGTSLDHERLYILQNSAFSVIDEYFLLANRQLSGTYESGLPRAGLCIYHLDRDQSAGGRYNNGPPGISYYRMFHEMPNYDPNWYYYLSAFGGSDTVMYNRTDFIAPYAADYGYINFDTQSEPNCGRNTNNNSTPSSWGPVVTGISTSGYNMYFNVGRMASNPASPAIKVHSYTIKDPITPGYNNNDNNAFNAGELDTLILTFYNSAANATSVQESLYTSDPYVNVVNPGMKSIGDISYNTYASDAANPHLIRVAPDAPANHSAAFHYKVTATGYIDTGTVFISLNPLDVVWKFRPADVTHSKFRPMALAVYNDTIFLSDGDSLPPLSGTYRLYKFRPDGTLHSSVNNPGGSYVGSCDVEPSSGNLYWSIGDACYQTTRSFAFVNSFTHHNSSWGGTPMKRVRGLTFAPSNAPTNYGTDSFFVYWHTYEPAYEESLKMTSTPTAGTALRRAGWVIPEGEASPMDHWRNGRGLEHDGWCFWRICLFTQEIYRGRAPVNVFTSIDTLFTMLNPAYWGVYPGYDLDFQKKSSDGSEPHTAYARGNEFFLWTLNIESSEVMKVDVSSVVLPSPVENVFVARSGNNNLVIWDEKNHTVNPDTTEHIVRYIIYRTDNPNAIGDSIGYYNARTGYEADTFVDFNPAADWTVYYRVSAVNWFGFMPGHSNRSSGIISVEESPTEPSYRLMFYQIMPTITGKALNLEYEIPECVEVSLKIYNSLGAVVRTVVTQKAMPGKYQMTWFLTDDQDRNLANGIYFVRFTAGDKYEKIQKIILMR
ncbi:MAG: M6 family metalloprotease domain-containing protein [bacterium]